jgi:hypothetical protein
MPVVESVWTLLFVIVAVKLPIIACGWYLYRKIHDVPEPEIERRSGGEFAEIAFDPGPRRRGPSGAPVVTARRRETSHPQSQTRIKAESDA